MSIAEAQTRFIVPNTESAGNVAFSSLCGQIFLGRRRATAQKPVETKSGACLPGERLRQKRRLIEPALAQAPSMKRHRNENRRSCRQVLSGPRHPAPEHRGKLRAIAVFKPDNQAVRSVVINQRRSRMSKIRRLGDTGGTLNLLTIIGGKGNAATRTIWRLDEMRGSPCARAQRFG